MLISLDTEATGLDWAHGAMPFLVTTCADDGVIRFWEWDVDPITRRPEIPAEDIAAIRQLIIDAELIYLQNSKFDAHMLANIGIALPWENVRDTLCAGHLLASNHPHDLTSMCVEYLGRDISKYELAIKATVQACRNIVKKQHPDWRVADEGLYDMPSVKGSSDREEDRPWKNDMWLPRALLKRHGNYDKIWGVACSMYANADSEHTLPLGLEMERLIGERGLWNIYLSRLNLPRLAYEMERYGITAIGEYTDDTISNYERYSAEAGYALQEIAAGYGHDLELAQGASLNDNMRDFFYGSDTQKCPRCERVDRVKHWNGEEIGKNCPKCLKGTKRKPSVRQPMQKHTQRPNLNLPVIISKKTGNATLDKDAMAEYASSLEGEALEFVKLLSDKRKHDTDLGYMQSYRRFWRPIVGQRGYYRLHPSINPFGTDHLRCSSNNPNLQNVGKQEDKCDECDGNGCPFCFGTGKSRISVRNCFGPAPGREWYSMDYRQIENRIPPYECGEEKAIEVFEKPDAPPYWGSLYYLTASVLYPDEFWPTIEFNIDHPQGFKKRYPKLYKQAKFFNLAKQYGAGRNKGDALSKIKNSYDKVDNEFPKLAALQAYYLRHAERTGWVQTLPDRTVDPKRGYPILASRTEDNRVLSTTPFNYHVSGTACWCKIRAWERCSAKLAEWRADGFDAWLSLEIHDELLFDFPRGKDRDENLSRAMELRELMEQSGRDLVPAIPTPVSVEYHAVSWAEGVAC